MNVRTIKQTIRDPAFYTYTAEFLPDKDSGDRRATNNVAQTFVHARGVANVLLIEGIRGEHEELVSALRAKGLHVDVKVAPGSRRRASSAAISFPPTSPSFSRMTRVILGNVPKDAFTEEQIKLLASNTHDMGGGLVMLGGAEQLRPGRLDEHRGRESPAGRYDDQGHEGDGQVRARHGHARERNSRRKLLAKGRFAGSAQNTLALRLRRHAALGGSRGVAVSASADRREERPDAPRDRPHDSRRHARLRPVSANGHQRSCAKRPMR